MRIFLPLCLLFFFISCSKPSGQPSSSHQRGGFTTETRCPITPVKDQGKSPSCWIYAMLATIESNRLAMGDSVNLSAAYYERMLIEEQSEALFMNKGREEIKGRGMIPHLMTMLNRYGAFMENSFHHHNENFNFYVLSRKVQLLAQKSAGKGVGLKVFKQELSSMLDREISFLPQRQFLLGADYSPLEFGHSIALFDDYEFLGADYAFPDRRETDAIKSTSPQELLRITEKSIRLGNAVCWEGDISEPGFDWKNGIADIHSASNGSADLGNATLKRYQKDIETFKTTDDHCLEICGIAHDKTGKRYFICKNSWGKSNRFKGFIMMSYDYFLAKTILIGKRK